MTKARLRVGGTYLDAIAPVAEVSSSSVFRIGGFSGDFQVTATWAASSEFTAPWLRQNADVQLEVDGIVVAGGRLVEPTPGDNGWQITVNGYGDAAQGYLSIKAQSPGQPGPITPTFSANEAVDYAIANLNLPWRRFDSLDASGVAAGNFDGRIVSLSDVLDAHAKARGQFWHVDSFGEVTMRDAPESPTWVTTPDATYLGTTDEQYFSHLYGQYVYAVLGTPPTVSQYAWVVTSDPEAAEQFGYKAGWVDLTQLGQIPEAAAQMNINGRFKLAGARRFYANGFVLTPLNTFRAGFGPASPVGLRAGEQIAVPGVMDVRTTPTAGGLALVTAGEVQVNWSEQSVSVKPIGAPPRDFASVTAAATKPADSVEFTVA